MEYLHSCNRWLRLGLKLGLFYHTLQRIELENVNNIENCRIAMLDAWLCKQDGVGLKGGPTYRQLIGALRSIREGPIADKMEEELVRTSRKRPSSASPAARDPKYPRRKYETNFVFSCVSLSFLQLINCLEKKKKNNTLLCTCSKSRRAIALFGDGM